MPSQALVERILHFEGFYFSNKTLDLAKVNPNGFQVLPRSVNLFLCSLSSKVQ